MKAISLGLFLILSVTATIVILANLYTVDRSNNVERSKGTQLGNFRKQKLDDTEKNLFWFIQISDLHISKFKDPTRISDFRKFCAEAIDVINPKVVIASGDLTDAKDNILGSEQYVEEWEAYHKALTDHGVLNKTSWLDLRGNHDNFNVPQLHGPNDLFHNYSSQGRLYKKSYIHHVKVDGIKYDFVALDASIEPGSKRPYNFIGMIDHEELEHVKSLVKQSNANYSIWFAHYPTSTILTPPSHPSIRKFVGQFDSSVLFVAGHLHTLGRLVNRMYTLHAEGFLELELADFMRTRKFRISALDHGLLSIVDKPLDTYPIALITNPKNMLFNNPFKEDIELIKSSSHVRILAFSKYPITKCKINIDGERWINCKQKTANLFVVPWHPSKYSVGKHKIEVFIEDSSGGTFDDEHFFATDGTAISFDFLAKFILMSDLTTVFQVGYIIALVVCSLPLMIFKVWQILLKYNKIRRPKIMSSYWRRFAQKYIILCSVNRIYFGLIVMLIWTTTGPWSFHYILDGYRGYIFLWGIFVKDKFVPGTLTYWYGIHQLAWFQFPLMIILAGVVKRSFNRFVTGDKPEENFLQVLKSNLPFLALIIAELLLAIFYLIQNGFVAFLISPLRVWSVLYSLYLFYQAHYKIPDNCFRSSMRIFITEDEPKQS